MLWLCVPCVAAAALPIACVPQNNESMLYSCKHLLAFMLTPIHFQKQGRRLLLGTATTSLQRPNGNGKQLFARASVLSPPECVPAAAKLPLFFFYNLKRQLFGKSRFVYTTVPSWGSWEPPQEDKWEQRYLKFWSLVCKLCSTHKTYFASELSSFDDNFLLRSNSILFAMNLICTSCNVLTVWSVW